MKIEFWGAARSVTGSMHLLTVNGTKILLDCGLYQGRRQEAFERNRNLPFDATQIDAMILSHAHVDHSGNIPNLVHSGFKGNIYATFATRDLCSYMLRDSAHIMESDVYYLNKRRRREGLPLLEPIYETRDATRALSYFVGMDYERTMYVGPGVKLTFYDAGHILGSSLVVLDIEEEGRSYRLLFTGDLGRNDLLILNDPQPVSGVDYLITESTYGTRLHGSPLVAEQELERVVNETYKRRGKLIIPAFSVGRTQEIVYALHRLRVAGQIPYLPIYVDSPLSTNATEVFRLHPEYYDAETYEFMLKYKDPFGFSQLRYIRQVEDSKALNTRTEPMIIISASGMCETGRILHHLKNNIENPKNTILFVSFQAENTLGRRIRDGAERVRIYGQEYDVRAKIEAIDGYSAHADRAELLAFAEKSGGASIKEAFVVHGEEESALAIGEALKEMGIAQVEVPERGQSFII